MKPDHDYSGNLLLVIAWRVFLDLCERGVRLCRFRLLCFLGLSHTVHGDAHETMHCRIPCLWSIYGRPLFDCLRKAPVGETTMLNSLRPRTSLLSPLRAVARTCPTKPFGVLPTPVVLIDDEPWPGQFDRLWPQMPSSPRSVDSNRMSGRFLSVSGSKLAVSCRARLPSWIGGRDAAASNRAFPLVESRKRK
jgi:hypothetical protein